VNFHTGSLEQAATTSARPTRRGARASLGAVVITGAIGLIGVPSVAQAAAITPKAFCAKISAATVSSLFGQKVTLLGADTGGSAYNDVCEFAKIVGKSVSGVTLNYDYKGTGTASENDTALSKEQGVSGFAIKSYSAIGGTTYSFTDTYKSSVSKISESGMLSYSGANHYGVIVTDVLPTSKLAALMKLVVSAA